MKKTMTQSKKAKVLTLAMLAGMAAVAVFFATVIISAFLHEDALVKEAEYLVHVDGFADWSAYLTNEVRAYAATGDRVHYDNYWNEVNTTKSRDYHVEALSNLGLTAQEQSMIDEIFSISNNLIPLEEATMDMVERGELAEAVGILYGDEYMDGLAEISSIIEEFNNSTQTRVNRQVSLADTRIIVCAVLTYVIMAICLVMQIYFVRFIYKELLAPIRMLRDKMKTLVTGDFHSSMEMEEDDTEVGEAVRAIHQFQTYIQAVIEDIAYCLGQKVYGNFNVRSKNRSLYDGDLQPILVALRNTDIKVSETLHTITESVDHMVASTVQISDSAQSVAEGATDQASAVEELSVTINEIAADSAKTAEAAEALQR